MINTHTNFKSVDPNVPNADIMDDYVGGALQYQCMFDKRTTPWEKTLWDDTELENFKIDLEVVDRLYYIYQFDDGVNGREFQMTARMDYKGRKVYIELVAGCDYTGFDCQGGGVIFISLDANLFMKLILTEEYQSDLIYKSLAEDGIETEEQTEYDTCSRMRWTNAPMLKFLCHMSVYDNRKSLEHYPRVLPKILKDSVRDFIKTRDAKKSYDDWENS